jgi:uncharacterized delta-60 repeat protein
MLKTRVVLLAALPFCIAAATSHAQLRGDGYIDTNFTATCFGTTSPRALAIQFDGRIIAGGNFSAPGLACVNAIDRMSANGVPDSTFHSPFFAGDRVNAIAFQGNRLIVAGAMRDGTSFFPLARLNANGSIDYTFPFRVQGASILYNALLIQADGKIVAAGEANAGVVGGQPFGYIVRVTPDGDLDGSFVGGGGVTPPTGIAPVIAALAPAGGGKMLVGGAFISYRDAARPGLARINLDGTLDGSYLPQISDGIVRALAVQPDGKTLVAGSFTVNGSSGRALVRLNTDGTVDDSFQPLNGQSTIGLSVMLQPDGRVLLGHSFGVMRLLTNGSPDTTFGPRNAFAQLGTEADNVTALALTANTNLIIGASRVAVSGTERRGVARLFSFLPPLPPPPVIVAQPLTQVLDAGTNVTFSVMATGAPPLTYQWRRNGTRITGETNSTLSFTNINSTHTANYTVVVGNPGGSVTSVIARLIVNFDTSTFTLITNGLGVVLPNLAGKQLEIGLPYTITARPVIGNLFSNWTGGVTSSSPVLTFIMQSNLTIEVNFVPSPFIPVKGVYNGLFYDPAAPAHATAGALTLTLDEKGGARGSVRAGAQLRKFKGTFSVDRTMTVALPATATAPALELNLEVDVVNAIITGSVAFASNVSASASTLFAYRNPFSARANPAPHAAKYTAALPGADDSSVAPGGDGFAALTVNTAGRLSGAGSLADGTLFRILSAAGPEAQVPVYVSLYKGSGSLFGWLTVTNGEALDVSGTLWWTKPGSVGGVLYPGGFTRQLDVVGSQYLGTRGVPVMVLTNGIVVLSAGNLPEPLTNSITLGSDNRISGDNDLRIVFSVPKGTFTGSFIDPSNGRKRIIKGVALPEQQQGRGFFPGTSESGRVFIGDAP